MITLLTYIFMTGLVSFIYLTALKHNFPLWYENFHDGLSNDFIKSILPKDFCTLCFITQLTVMVSIILVIVLQLPAYHIIMYGLGVPAFVIHLTKN